MDHLKFFHERFTLEILPQTTSQEIERVFGQVKGPPREKFEFQANSVESSDPSSGGFLCAEYMRHCASFLLPETSSRGLDKS